MRLRWAGSGKTSTMAILQPGAEPPQQPYELDSGHALEPAVCGEGEELSLLNQLLGEAPAPVARDVRGRLWRVRATQRPRPDALMLVAVALGALLLVVLLMALGGI